MIGIEALANRLLGEFKSANGTANEALLTLADFFIVLFGVDYRDVPGALPKVEFDATFRAFLKDLATDFGGEVAASSNEISADAVKFWERVVHICQA